MSLKDILYSCLHEPDVNSRFVFFVHGVSATAALIALTIAFIATSNKEAYPTMVMAVGGSGAAAAVGRYLTKKGGGDGDRDGSATVDQPK